MSRPRWGRLTIGWAGLLVGLLGCTPARMPMPDDLAGVARWPVEGRQAFRLKERLTFGPYATSRVQRGWTRRTAWGAGPYESRRARQRYELVLDGPDGSWLARCAASVDSQGLVLEDVLGGRLDLELTGQRLLMAELGPIDGTPAWHLVLDQDHRPTARGLLTDGRQRVEIEATHRLDGSRIPLSDPSGYLLSVAGRRVAAIEVINRGAVWLPADLPFELRRPLAVVAAVLLLFQQLD